MYWYWFTFQPRTISSSHPSLDDSVDDIDPPGCSSARNAPGLPQRLPPPPPPPPPIASDGIFQMMRLQSHHSRRRRGARIAVIRRGLPRPLRIAPFSSGIRLDASSLPNHRPALLRSAFGNPEATSLRALGFGSSAEAAIGQRFKNP